MPPKTIQSVPLLPLDNASVNNVLLKEVQDMVLNMKKHKVLKHCWTDIDALDIKDGGQLGPFDSAKFKQAMAERPGASPDDYTFESLGCMSALNFLATSTPGVRISQGQVDRAIAQDFPRDKPFTRITRSFVIQVPDRKWDPQAHRGSWTLVSGIERLLALIQVSERCLNDEKLAKQYRTMCRNLKFQFMLVPHAELSLRSFQLREDRAEDGDVESFSALQKIEFIAKDAKSLEAQNGRTTAVKDLMQHFQSLRLARGSEKFTFHMLDSALSISNRMLSSTVALEALQTIENLSASRSNSPLNSISKLQVVLNKCKTKEGIEWFFQMVVLGLKQNYVKEKDLVQASLQKSTCALILMKHDFLNYFIKTFMPRHNFHQETREALFNSMSSFEKLYDRMLDKKTGKQTSERSFIRSLPESGKKLLNLVEHLVYRDAYDATIKTGMKNGKSASEILEYETLKEQTSTILQKLQAEIKEKDEAEKAARVKENAANGLVDVNANDPNSTTKFDPDAAQTTASGPLHCSKDDKFATLLSSYLKCSAEGQAVIMSIIDDHYRQFCRLFVISDDLAELKQELKTSGLAMSEGNDSGTVLFHWDLGLSAESVTHPSERIPAFNVDGYNRLVRCVLESRSGPSFNSETHVAQLGTGEVVLLLDGGRQGYTSNKQLQTPWMVKPDKTGNDDQTDSQSGSNDGVVPGVVSQHIVLVKDLKALQARRSLNRHGLCGLNQNVGTDHRTMLI